MNISIFENIKKIFIKKEIPRIESIETYEDVNLFLAGYKYYFEKRPAQYYYEWCFSTDDDNITIIKKVNRYFVNGLYEPNIRAYIWDNRDIINAELKRQKEKSKSKEREQMRKEDLENQIKKTAI